ncbi:hypothetical protein ACFQ6B_40820 [Streptomyces wedmorensis]|uniref:Uncharacterized protein n=1 Tax=Streptomyces wedmorensis TaxID=43759 RepID=A0ABW6J2L7_STRWE
MNTRQIVRSLARPALALAAAAALVLGSGATGSAAEEKAPVIQYTCGGWADHYWR